MTRAEEVALERCPISSDTIKESRNQKKRAIFCNGYEQAEKDIITTIESRISEILGDAQPAPVLRAELQDLIKRIKEEV